jgi:hypothetical protein
MADMTRFWIGLGIGLAIGLGIGLRNGLVVGVGVIGLIYVVWVVWKNHRTEKTEWTAAEGAEAAEAVQEPSLNSDADWTSLDQLALDIARLEALTLWHSNERPLFRDIPVRNVNVEGGWDLFCDDWENDISVNYEQIFREIRTISPSQRARRLRLAKEKSAYARTACTAMSITLPDGSKNTLPSWMIITPGKG